MESAGLSMSVLHLSNLGTAKEILSPFLKVGVVHLDLLFGHMKWSFEGLISGFLQTGSCWLEVASSFHFAEDGPSLFCDGSCDTNYERSEVSLGWKIAVVGCDGSEGEEAAEFGDEEVQLTSFCWVSRITLILGYLLVIERSLADMVKDFLLKILEEMTAVLVIVTYWNWKMALTPFDSKCKLTSWICFVTLVPKFGLKHSRTQCVPLSQQTGISIRVGDHSGWINIT